MAPWPNARRTERAMMVAAVCAAMGCEPVTLRLPEAPPAPTTAPAPVTPVETGACSTPCMGGRRCEAGACVPHWLPIRAPEVADREARTGQYAVWTGEEVIVWGGHDPDDASASGVRGDGFRFDPTRGEVRVLPATAAPAARWQDGQQTAVWDGRAMIILGGITASGEAHDSAAYVPSLDAWERVPASPVRASGLSAVFTGNEVLVWSAAVMGGASGAALRAGASGWAVLPSLAASAPREGHTAVWTGAEMLVWGGYESGALRDDGLRYAPSKGRSRPMGTARAPSARRRHTAVWTSSEMLVFGGQVDGERAIAEAAAYVPAVDQWREMLPAEGAPSPRWGHVAAWDGSGMVVWGGTDGAAVRADGAVFDPVEGTWRAMPPLPEGSRGRWGAAAVWTGRELLILGGTEGRPTLDPLGWRYQP
ncbi:MAG: hypothetical protein R3A52_04585 [Polyangiales bacterium]